MSEGKPRYKIISQDGETVHLECANCGHRYMATASGHIECPACGT